MWNIVLSYSRLKSTSTLQGTYSKIEKNGLWEDTQERSGWLRVSTIQSWRSNPQQRNQTASMWGQMSKHLLPDSPSKSQKERAPCTGGPRVVWPNRGVAVRSGCSSCSARDLVWLWMVKCGHGVKAHRIHPVTRRLQQACRWCSCIDPVPLPLPLSYLQIMIKMAH